MKLKFKDNRIMLLCSFRYALGRFTYIVETIIEELENNWDKLEKHDREQIKNDIKNYEQFHGELRLKTTWNKVLNFK